LGIIEEIENIEPTVPQVKYDLVRREKTRLKTALDKQYEENEKLKKTIDLLTKVEDSQIKPPKWTYPYKKKHNKNLGIPSLVISDTHFDEVVQPAEVDFLNKYDREIAEARLKRTFEKSIYLSREYISGITYEGFVLFLGGDMVTGTIHDELAETNDAYMPDTILYWSEQLTAGIEMLLEEFGKVHIAGVVGNHGRNTMKPRMKGRVRDNWDWLIYKLIARDFKNEPNVTFQIPDSADCIVPIYDTKFLFTHGDQFSGGGGVAGIAPTLMRGDAKKRKRYMETDTPYDYMVMGHWHQYTVFKSIIVNGSNKGFDEYAYIQNFDYEPPQQAFWVNTPEHGPILHAPVFCQDRKKEGW
jgi:predicted phosphodiesterase